MGNADDTDLDDVRMGHQGLLDLGREDVESRHDHQVLGTIDEVQVAVVVRGRHVAGLQPTVLGEHRRRGLGVVEVAGEHVVATHPDLTDVAHEGVAVLGHEPHLDAVQGPSDRARTAPGRRSRW